MEATIMHDDELIADNAAVEAQGAAPVAKKSLTMWAPEFGARLRQAVDSSPNVPAPNFGRLGWIVRKLDEKGETVSEETVRRWLLGHVRPRHRRIELLSEILGVDVAWLGVGSAADLTPKEKRVRGVAASGAVNLIAGFVQMDGGTPAFPEDGDARATEAEIDLYAIIKGAQYAIHVATAREVEGGWQFGVPTPALGNLVIGVIRTGKLAVRLVDLDRDGLETVGTRKGGYIEVTMSDALVTGDRTWREIEGFTTRP